MYFIPLCTPVINMVGSRKQAHQITIGSHSTKLLETMFAPRVYSKPNT